MADKSKIRKRYRSHLLILVLTLAIKNGKRLELEFSRLETLFVLFCFFIMSILTISTSPQAVDSHAIVKGTVSMTILMVHVKLGLSVSALLQ